MNNNAVTLTVAGNATLPVGSYELIAPGSGGSVTGSVSGSLLTANDTDDETVSLVISNSGLYLRVNPSTASIPVAVSLSSSPKPSAYGTVPVTFIATANPAPTNGEQITFLDGTNVLGTVAMTNGAAAFSTGTLALGTHMIAAAYGGDGLYMPATSSVLTQVVSQAIVSYPQAAAFPLFVA